MSGLPGAIPQYDRYGRLIRQPLLNEEPTDINADDPPEPTRLTLEQLAYMRTASRWGLLRPLSGMKLLLAGRLSMTHEDLRQLIKAAGGQSEASWGAAEPGIEALVLGEIEEPRDPLTLNWASPQTFQTMAMEHCFEVWTEADLVLRLVPSYDSLLARPGQAPF